MRGTNTAIKRAGQSPEKALPNAGRNGAYDEEHDTCSHATKHTIEMITQSISNTQKMSAGAHPSTVSTCGIAIKSRAAAALDQKENAPGQIKSNHRVWDRHPTIDAKLPRPYVTRGKPGKGK